MTQPVDRSILQEIVHIVEARRKVPERVRVRAREYLITYLEDHQRRLQEALHRYDSDRLNMLYGQLASKVKYQLLRRLPVRATAATKKLAGTGTPKVAKDRVSQKTGSAKSSKKVAAKKTSNKKTATKKLAPKKATGKKVPSKKVTAKTNTATKGAAKKGSAKARVVKKPSASRKHK